MSSETIQLVATLATVAVVAIGVTFAAVQVRHEVLTRRLQGKSGSSRRYGQRRRPALCGPWLVWDQITRARISRRSAARP